MTDITGFGLIGHSREILLASNVSIELQASKVPLLDGALDCIHAGHIPGGLNNNRDFAECLVEYDAHVPEDLRTILYDPQTAGGLLISTPDGEALDPSPQPSRAFPPYKSAKSSKRSKPRIQVGMQVRTPRPSPSCQHGESPRSSAQSRTNSAAFRPTPAASINL